MVTAEIAITMPALIVITATVIALVIAGLFQILVTHAAGIGARAAARGDDPAAAVSATTDGRMTTVSISDEGEFSCVNVSAAGPPQRFLHLPAPHARACALKEGGS